MKHMTVVSGVNERPRVPARAQDRCRISPGGSCSSCPLSLLQLVCLQSSNSCFIEQSLGCSEQTEADARAGLDATKRTGQ